MNVLIAGGTGFIGQALCDSLLRDGHAVWVLTRHPRAAAAPEGVQLVGWDGRTVDGWGHLAADMDAIVNLAGENIGALPWTNERKARLRSSRVEAGQALVESVRQAPMEKCRVRVFLQASGVGYYGTDEDETFNEDASPGSDFQARLCVDWEASTQPVEELGVRRVITRSGVVLGQDSIALRRFLYPWRLSLGGPMGSGWQWLPWIHIADEVGAMRFLLEREDAISAFNLVAPEQVRNEAFGRTLAEVLGKRYGMPIPAFAIQALYGEVSTMVLEGQRVAPERLLALGYSFKFSHLRDALKDLLK